MLQNNVLVEKIQLVSKDVATGWVATEKKSKHDGENTNFQDNGSDNMQMERLWNNYGP